MHFVFACVQSWFHLHFINQYFWWWRKDLVFFACGALAVVLIDWREKKVLGVGVLSVVVIKKEARSMVRAVRT